MGFSNIFLQPSFPKEKGVILNDTCRIVLLIALSILETLFLKLGGTYYIEIDKLRDYQQKLNIHNFLSCSIFDWKQINGKDLNMINNYAHIIGKSQLQMKK